MLKITRYLILFFLSLNFLSFTSNSSTSSKKPLVLVSLPPYQEFIERIAGDKVDCMIMVPEGVNSHTFEPKPKQFIASSRATVWFRSGDAFEEQLAQAYSEQEEPVSIVDLRKDIKLLKDSCSHSHHHHESFSHHHSGDVHTWLSLPIAMHQARVIAEKLSKISPENKEFFSQNLELFLSEMQSLHDEFQTLFAHCQKQHIMVSHGAFAYFCHEYGLKQVSVESDGKDPSTFYAASLVDKGRELKIKTIFLQKEHNNKGALRIAQELDLKTEFLYPYSRNYLANLKELATAFARECQ